ncbi:MAG: galactose-1-phosphate uridylyltransferase [Clostridia bacterium]|nr:galactose-1-phosphate uridylyltransferase [Clostridia bacterium]
MANAYPVFTPRPDVRSRSGIPWREVPAVGVHEVVVETPDHDRPPAAATTAEVEVVLRAYQLRIGDLRRAGWRWVAIFKNQGREAGMSLPHPHSQIAAARRCPDRVRLLWSRLRAYRARTGRSLVGEVAAAELAAGERLIWAGAGVVAYAPFAGPADFAVRLAPLPGTPAFAVLAPAQLTELAEALRRCLVAFERALGGTSWNYYLHVEPASDPEASWFLDLVPRRSQPAGLEMGTGLTVHTVSPEETATFLRRHVAAAGPAPGRRE